MKALTLGIGLFGQVFDYKPLGCPNEHKVGQGGSNVHLRA